VVVDHYLHRHHNQNELLLIIHVLINFVQLV
jgi:hypothetical protein